MQVLIKRFGLFGGLGAFAAYAGCCAYMFARQAHLLYQPNPRPDADPEKELKIKEEKALQKNKRKKPNDTLDPPNTNNSTLHLFEDLPDSFTVNPPSTLASDVTFFPSLGLSGWVDNPGKTKAVIYYGGSSEIIRLRRASFDTLKWKNYTRYFLPYRGFWPNQALTPSEVVLKNDAVNLFDMVSQLHKKVYIVGRSLGTSISLHVAANRQVEKMILITPFYSILNLAKQRYKIFPVQQILRDRHEAHKDAPLVKNQVHVFLAETDEVTPKSSWEQLKEHFSIPFKEKVILESNHTTIVEKPDLWDGMINFFEQRSKKKKSIQKAKETVVELKDSMKDYLRDINQS